MEPKSKSTELLINPSKLTTSEFGQVSPTEWRVAGKVMTIDEIIEDEAQHVNSTDLRVLESFSGRVLDKLKESNSDAYPRLREAVRLTILVLESSAAQHVKAPLPGWLAETGFGAAYFLKKFDLIPDHLPEIGLADDALILQRVIERNQSQFRRRYRPSRHAAATKRISRCVNSGGLVKLTEQHLGITYAAPRDRRM